MYIKSLQLKNFKRFDELHIDFPDDITVIKGPNEKGKSTIVEALAAALFFDPAKSNKAIEALRRWNSKQLYTTTLIFEVEGEEYVLTKDFEKKQISLVNQSTGQLWDTYQEIQNVLGEFGGYRSEALFRNVAVLAGESMALLKDGKKALDDMIQNLLLASSPGVRLGDILRKIDKAIENLEKGLGGHAVKYPGRIRLLENEISARTRDSKKLEEVFGRRESVRLELLGLREAMAGVLRELDLRERQIRENQTYFSSILEMQKISADLERVEKKRNELISIKKQAEGLSAEIAPLKAIEEADFSKIHELEKELEVARHDLGSSARELEHVPREGRGAVSFLAPRYLVPLVILVLGGFAGFFASPLFFVSWFFALVLGAFLFFFERQAPQVSSRALRARFKTKRDRKERLEAILGQSFAAFDVSSTDELREKAKRYGELQAEYGKLKSKEEGILEGYLPEDIEKQYRDLVRRLAVEEEKISARQKAHPPTERDERNVEREKEELTKEKSRFEKDIARTEAILSELKVGAEDMNRIEEEITWLSEELSREKDRLEVLRLLKTKLTESKQEAAKGLRGTVKEIIERFLSEITDSRYSNIKIDDDLNVQVYSEEKGDHITPEDGLSRGTIDQIYLSLRFAFLEIFFGRVPEKGPARRPLIILDDPFHTFDAGRRSRARILLQGFSERFQIILFTHSDLYDEWGTVKKL